VRVAGLLFSRQACRWTAGLALSWIASGRPETGDTMITKLIPLALAAALAACTASGPRPQPQQQPSPAGGARPAPGSTCDAEPVQDLVGSKLTPQVTEQARARSGSTYTRVLRPGQVMTMEYNAERITLILDERDVITKLHCG